jgi:hypothetical protein
MEHGESVVRVHLEFYHQFLQPDRPQRGSAFLHLHLFNILCASEGLYRAGALYGT